MLQLTYERDNVIYNIARYDDGMVNLVDMWKAQGRPNNRNPYEWSRLPETQALILQIQSELGTGLSRVIKVTKGKGGGTRAIPKLAIAYAEYLSPAFHSWALGTLQRFIEGDHELAKEITNRQTDVAKVEDIEETAKARRKYLTTYRPLMDAVKDAGGDQNTYRNIQRLNNKAITGKTNDQLRAAFGVKNARDAFDPQQLTELSVLQGWQSHVIDETDNKYDAYAAAKELAGAFADIKTKYLRG